MSRPIVFSISRLMGHQVVNAAGERLGHIDDVVIDDNSGRIMYAVLSHGGFLNMGETLTPVPWQSLQLDSVRRILTLNMDRQTLRNAPHIDRKNWPDMTDWDWQLRVSSYFDFNPADEPASRPEFQQQFQHRRPRPVARIVPDERAEEFIDDSEPSMNVTGFDDARLESEIETELQAIPDLVSDGIRVEVLNGIAVLQGNVASPSDSHIAAKTARHVRGVRDVINKLRISKVA
jgi:sporulation protein YlmC with PRC-barrel domain